MLYRSISPYESPEKRDNSAFWRVLAGHSTQHMSEKRDVPPKTGQLACMRDMGNVK